jgi:hypothetical protein
MKRYFFTLLRHATLLKLLFVLAIIIAIALAGAAPYALDP